jgi:hypothetical protein
MTEQEALENTEAFDKKHEFTKFKVKLELTADQIKEAVMDEDHTYACENLDYIWDLIVEKHKNANFTDDDYLEMYIENVYREEENKNLVNQLYKEVTNGTNE